MKLRSLSFVLLFAVSCTVLGQAETDGRRRAFVHAAFVANHDTVARLLKDGVDPNVTLGVYDKSLFSRAEGRLSPINSGEWTALIALAYSQEKADRQIGIARDLLRAGARIDIADGFGVTALHAAIMNDAVELALFLIKQGAPVNGTIKNMLDDVGDETPLHLAVGHPLIVEALIAAGCNLQARDGAGKSAFDTAKALGYSESEAIIAKAMRIKKR